ncbi:MAG TPA: CoA pyrophosphatase [Actinotalea caeni]|uniref:NUDIX hydrolase n=1 Tax=Actinotalea caeni TaxID=1348467 RepID=UPI0012E0D22D|nr:CoA pyrophosphatase [Actinotalea caeni]HLV54341.1 CoA pyrophosphatase [Actinotalea caeni]
MSTSVRQPHPARGSLEEFVARVAAEGMTPLGGMHAYEAERAAGFRASAVLALFAPTADPARLPESDPVDGVDIFLVQRSPLLRHHPGQIALPGGSLEPGESEVEAALRETHEEIGLAPDLVEVLAVLDPVLVPFSRFVVTPVLGWTDSPGAVSEVSPGEVLHTLRVPVAHLLDPAHRATVTIGGHGSAGFALDSGWVWGFTGNLLDHLFTEMGWSRPWPRERVHEMTMSEARGDRFLDR